jgi:hypothetical protein
MLSVNYAECRKQDYYTECRYAECRCAEWRSAQDIIIAYFGVTLFETIIKIVITKPYNSSL